MCKKYVLLAVCAALVIALIHAPDSWGKVRAAKTFDGKVWVRIDEVDSHPWNDVAVYPGNGRQGNRLYFLILTPYFTISFPLVPSSRDNNINSSRIQKGAVGVIEYAHHDKWRVGCHRRID